MEERKQRVNFHVASTSPEFKRQPNRKDCAEGLLAKGGMKTEEKEGIGRE